MNDKLFNFNKLVNSKKGKKEISNSITCAKYDYVKNNNGKKIKYQFTTKLVSNIDVPYKRYELQ